MSSGVCAASPLAGAAQKGTGATRKRDSPVNLQVASRSLRTTRASGVAAHLPHALRKGPRRVRRFRRLVPRPGFREVRHPRTSVDEDQGVSVLGEAGADDGHRSCRRLSWCVADFGAQGLAFGDALPNRGIDSIHADLLGERLTAPQAQQTPAPGRTLRPSGTPLCTSPGTHSDCANLQRAAHSGRAGVVIFVLPAPELDVSASGCRRIEEACSTCRRADLSLC